MAVSLLFLVCALPLALAAPYMAPAKVDPGHNRYPLMYHQPDVHRNEAKPAPLEVHLKGSSVTGESPPDRSRLFKCAEARLEEVAEQPAADSDGGLQSVDAIMNIVKATDFASHKHHYQRRKDPEGSPYIEHPVAVAHILTHLGKVSNPLVIVAALLHDTVEDTDTTFEEIEREFGPKVRSVVEELTDNKLLAKQERKRMQILHASQSTHEAKLIKLADKLHNLRDMARSLPVDWTEERRTEYFNWAREVVNGMRGTNAPIEGELDAMFEKYCTPS